jgi:hypothetical protein
MYDVVIHRRATEPSTHDATLYYASSEDEAIEWARGHLDCLPRGNGDAVYVIHGDGGDGPWEHHDIYVTFDGEVSPQLPIYLGGGVQGEDS